MKHDEPEVEAELAITRKSLLTGEGEAWLLGWDGHIFWLFHRDAPSVQARWSPGKPHYVVLNCLSRIRAGSHVNMVWSLPNGETLRDRTHGNMVLDFLNSLTPQEEKCTTTPE